MEIKYLSTSVLSSKADLLAVCVYDDAKKDALVKSLDKAMGGRLFKQLAAEDFTGKLGQSCVIYPDKALPCAAVALIGAGTVAEPGSQRDVGAYAYKVARRLKSRKLAVVLPAVAAKSLDRCAQFVAEGTLLGSYKFSKYLTGENASEQPVKSIAIHADRSATVSKKKPATNKTVKAAVARGVVIAEATCHARDMVNEPPEFLNPSQVEKIARGIAKKHASVSVKILGVKECEKLGMGMFLAVGRGSARPSRFIHLTYKPAKKPAKVITFVGKGVTFDSGGYSLKPSASMVDMKIDMAGCAAVVSSMDAIATLGGPNEVHVITACCENLVSGDAYLLGDVLHSMDGTTVEITNTDAEGRLTLGDALTYAQRKTKPDELFDFATLTGACMVALGGPTAGVFSNSDDLVKRWLASGEAADEDMWQMPLNKKLKRQLKSPIADLRNSGERWGGAITAALFLDHFVKDTNWVHVDLAGPAYGNREQGAIVRGATGYAVASIVEHATK